MEGQQQDVGQPQPVLENDDATTAVQTMSREEVTFHVPPAIGEAPNVLSFQIPGFDQTLSIQFPGSRLPVCNSCKRLYKTRDICRVQSKHTGTPWSPVYLCLTFDLSCTDERGMLVDKPLVCRLTPSQPYIALPSFFERNNSVPVCSPCKKTNRAKKTCRGRYGHRHLPWTTVYALVSTEETVDHRTIAAPPSRPASSPNDKKKRATSPSQTRIFKSTKTSDQSAVAEKNDDRSMASTSPLVEETVIVSKVSHDSPESNRSKNPVDTTTSTDRDPKKQQDDLYPIPASRTMILTISTRSTTINWLELNLNSGPRKRPGIDVTSQQHNVVLPSPNPTHQYHGVPANAEVLPYTISHHSAPPIVGSSTANDYVSFPSIGREEVYGSAFPQPDPQFHQPEHQSFLVSQGDNQGWNLALNPHRSPGEQLRVRQGQNTIAPSQPSVTAGEAAAATAAARQAGSRLNHQLVNAAGGSVSQGNQQSQLIVPQFYHSSVPHLGQVPTTPDTGIPPSWNLQIMPAHSHSQLSQLAQTSGLQTIRQSSGVETNTIGAQANNVASSFHVPHMPEPETLAIVSGMPYTVNPSAMPPPIQADPSPFPRNTQADEIDSRTSLPDDSMAPKRNDGKRQRVDKSDRSN